MYAFTKNKCVSKLQVHCVRKGLIICVTLAYFEIHLIEEKTVEAQMTHCAFCTASTLAHNFLLYFSIFTVCFSIRWVFSDCVTDMYAIGLIQMQVRSKIILQIQMFH